MLNIEDREAQGLVCWSKEMSVGTMTQVRLFLMSSVLPSCSVIVLQPFRLPAFKPRASRPAVCARLQAPANGTAVYAFESH